MFYIIGTKQDREAFENANNIPFFEIEEQLDDNTTCLHNCEDDTTALFIDIAADTYTVAVNNVETVYTDYAKAVEAYENAGKPQHEKLYSLTETAEKLGVTRQRVHQMLQAGSIDGVKVGNTWVVYADSID